MSAEYNNGCECIILNVRQQVLSSIWLTDRAKICTTAEPNRLGDKKYHPQFCKLI